MNWSLIKTRPFLPPKDDIYQLLDQHLPPLVEGDVLFVTSKILGIHEGRCIKATPDVSKDDLIVQEAEKYIPREDSPNEYVILTIKKHTMLSSAGIDRSNANGYFVLWPKDPKKCAHDLWVYLRRKFGLRDLGVIVTDSCSLPLRAGTIGISIGFYGLQPLRDYRQKPDIFGRPLEVTRSNIIDGLAAMAVLLMGEGREQTPMVLARGLDFVRFTASDTYNQLMIPMEDDMYYPLLKVFRDAKGR